MSSFLIISTHSLKDLQQRAYKLVDKGYIPAGGITQVPYSSDFDIGGQNTVSNSDITTHIQFLQSFYKPPTNSI